MIKLSLCMIVRNEEQVLSRCLNSCGDLFDEIVIVDTGSNDSTKQVAASFGAKIYDFEWVDDFSLSRNYSFSKATGDYVMWLDADDYIPENTLSSLKALKANFDKSVDIVYLKYNLAFDENGEATFSFFRERIIKNCEHARFCEPVHEAIIPFGKSIYFDLGINHAKPSTRKKQNDRNLKIIERAIKDGKSISPRLTYYYARELVDNGKIKKAIGVYRRFLKMDGGWIENKIAACLELSNALLMQNRQDEAVIELVKSFALSAPRPEIACELGRFFLNNRDLSAAAFWYETALNTKNDKNSLAFINADYYGFIPAIQLAVVYDRIGDTKKAAYYNELAGSYQPNNKAYLYNKEYFLGKG